MEVGLGVGAGTGEGVGTMVGTMVGFAVKVRSTASPLNHMLPCKYMVVTFSTRVSTRVVWTLDLLMLVFRYGFSPFPDSDREAPA
jgi:hypothetical protein